MNATIQSLFDAPDDVRGMARRRDPDTSIEAARIVKPKAQTDRDRALAVLRDHPSGLTDFELGELMVRQQTSAGKRRGELVARGLVEKTSIKRPAPSGTPAYVWRAVLSTTQEQGSSVG